MLRTYYLYFKFQHSTSSLISSYIDYGCYTKMKTAITASSLGLLHPSISSNSLQIVDSYENDDYCSDNTVVCMFDSEVSAAAGSKISFSSDSTTISVSQQQTSAAAADHSFCPSEKLNYLRNCLAGNV